MFKNHDGIRYQGVLVLTMLLIAGASFAELPVIEIEKDDAGQRLRVDGQDMMVFGMNWGYMPIGQNYSYDFWGQPESVIKEALSKEMPLLKAMGVNTIRHYVGMPPRWVKYVYETYGIWTILNHTVGRYGLTIDGVWKPQTDYSDPKVRSIVKSEIADLVDEFKDTPGVLMWLLGNENNYGLSWSSFEIEALPEGERNQARARHLYSLFGEIISDIHAIDPHRPVAMANGDLQYIDIIAEECSEIDVFGSNVYRGISARDYYAEVKAKLDVPTMFTEFGADAFNAISMSEDQLTQAKYLVGQWQEIYEQSAGKGRVGNAIGGLIFQWSDGWWKFRQEERLDIHDTNASWPNAGYWEDYTEGENNMNEEWWGLTAKGRSNIRGVYEVYPRAAYYALMNAFRLDPYAPGTDITKIREHFASIIPMESVLRARGDAATLKATESGKVRISGVRMEFETYATGAKNSDIPEVNIPGPDYPAFQGFDHGQSFFVDIEAKPNDAVIGRASINLLGHVPTNPIDEIFYENRGRPHTFQNDQSETVEVNSVERVALYNASVNWDDKWFMLDAFYRVGHLHWQYEGDFFGLYRDGYYGENLDIYNGAAPIGFEMAGKKSLRGLKIAFGPQLWWGANPAIFLKYQRRALGADWTAVVQEDFTEQTDLSSSIAIPVRTNRKASIQMQRRLGPFGFEGGVLWAGQPRIDESFQLLTDEAAAGDIPISPQEIRTDVIRAEDTLGCKAKLTWQQGRWNWYGQGAYMGLVADGGPTSIPTFTGWSLKESGSGNQVNAITGLAATYGQWQIGPNFLWQKPIVGPMGHTDDLYGTQGTPRNVIDDPFAVVWNRETTAVELMLTYDPTPATWMWAWDSDKRENADLAASIGLVLKRHHTGADGRLFIGEGGVIYPFGGGTPARDLWSVQSRIINRVGSNSRMVSHIAIGQAEPNGNNSRLIERVSIDSRIVWPRVAFAWHLKFDDFGPYDYHRDHNLTYPMQTMADLSITLGRPEWFYDQPQTRLGVRAIYRTLDRFSPRYHPDGLPDLLDNELYPEGLTEGHEWEIRTYLHLAI